MHTSFRRLNLYHISYPNETARMLPYRFRIYRGDLFPTHVLQISEHYCSLSLTRFLHIKSGCINSNVKPVKHLFTCSPRFQSDKHNLLRTTV